MEEIIFRHLVEYGSITSWEAIKEYGCTRLSHYIYLLRKYHNITDERIKTINRFGMQTTYKKYTLNDDEN